MGIRPGSGAFPPSRLSLINFKKCTMNLTCHTRLATKPVAALLFKGLLPTGIILSLTASELRAEEIDFRSKIQPIFAEHCSQCHGVDEAKREGGFRLDTREGALAGGESGVAAIVPGKSAESELVRRILSEDLDSRMPPPSEKKPLSPEQKEILQRLLSLLQRRRRSKTASMNRFNPRSSSKDGTRIRLPNHGNSTGAFTWICLAPLHPPSNWNKRNRMASKLPSIGCFAIKRMERNGRDHGWMWLDTPTPTDTRRICSAINGRGETGSSMRSIAICLTINSSSSKSPAICCPMQPKKP